VLGGTKPRSLAEQEPEIVTVWHALNMAISLPLAVLDRITRAERKAFVMVELQINATIYHITRCGVIA